MTSKPVKYHSGQFPPKNLDWSQLIPKIGPTAAAIARYDGTLTSIPNADVLLSPLTIREAVLSSKIEGTQTTTEEVWEFEAEGSSSTLSPEKQNDALEKAMEGLKSDGLIEVKEDGVTLVLTKKGADAINKA